MVYAIEYTEKENFWSSTGLDVRKTALVTEKQLVEILTRKKLWTVWSARLVNYEQYTLNYEPGAYTDFTGREVL